jgi:RimJ/RimL family protein N-acetyltransferase
VTSRYWPVADLRLTTPRLVLRPFTEADLAGLADVVPDDFDTDPSLPTHHVDDPRTAKGIAVHQSYWQAMATWSPASWRLPFVVALDGRPVGMQELEADGFAGRRVVGSGSWLVPDVRGRGIGTEMRAAVLHLAFGGLGAEVAETEAWWDNHASLGVSRSLGYEPNGETIHVHRDRRDRIVRLRLTADRWAAVAGAHPTTVTGLDACRHLFGVAGGGPG